MSGGLINGYSIAAIAAAAYGAQATANSAYNTAASAYARANAAYDHLPSHSHTYVAPGTINVNGQDYYCGGAMPQTSTTGW